MLFRKSVRKSWLGVKYVVKLKLNDKEIEAEKGKTLLEIALENGFDIPHLCMLKDLYYGTSCRLCLVMTSRGKLIPSCYYRVSGNEEFIVDSPELREIRRVNFELILSYHKVECWLCNRKNNCKLMDISRKLGVEGLPVCSQCPLAPEECLLKKGILCLGMITLSGCDAECIISGGQCWGCRGPVTREDILERAFRRYKELGFDLNDVLFRAEIFWNSLKEFEKIREVVEKVKGDDK